MRKLITFLFVLLTVSVGAMAQTKTIHGTVVDALNNDPLVGATVMPIGGGQGVATDSDGKFTLIVGPKVKTVKVSYVGYNPQVAEVKDGMTVYLTENSANLDDLIVVAYGQQKKSSITGAVSQVNADKIAERPTSSVAAALEGTTTGITVTGNYGEAGSDPTITIRGVGTVNGTNSPLYVVDGVPFGGNVSDLNPDDIESMSILKDAASTALYGNRASNGVILITTKKAKTTDKIKINFKTSQGWYQRAIPEYERTDIPQWMEAQFLNYRNGGVVPTQKGFSWSDAEAIAAANKTAGEKFIGSWAYLNIFNADDNKLFDANGKFDRSLSIMGTYGEDLNWWDEAIRTGYRGEYSLSVMGATSKSDYNFSLSYLNEDGYMRDNDYERITGRAQINVNPLKWLKTGLNMNVSHQKTHGTMNGVGDGNTSFNNAWFFCRYMSPIYPVHLHDVNTGDYILNNGELQFDPGYYNIKVDGGSMQQVNTRNQYVNRNVIWESQVNTRATIRNTMNANAYFDIILPYGFVATMKGNLNTRNSDAFEYSSALIGDAVNEGAYNKTYYTYKNWTFQQQLNWRQTYGEKHNISALLAHENYSYQYDYAYANKRGQAFEGLTAFSNFSEMKTISGYRNIQKTESYLGRVQYNYDERYNLEASFRRDGTSRFAKNVRWGNFGSVGANWVFSNEEFLKNVGWLNNGKLYVNWGQVGNDAAAGYYAYYPLMYGTTNMSLPAYYMYQLAADDLKWETSESFGLGFETTLFNRWNLSVEFYNKVNKDLIFAVNLPASAGPTDYPSTSTANHPTLDQNIGSIRNTGVEISTDVDIYKDKNWKINVGTNFSYNQNKITKLPDENIYLIGYNQDGTERWEDGYTTGSYYKISQGHSRYQFYFPHYAGVDQMTGQSLYDADLTGYYIKKADGSIVGGTYKKDASGNLVLDTDLSKELTAANYVEIDGKYYVYNASTYGQRKWSATTLPKIQGSFNAGISYKGLSVNALFTYSLGGKIYDSNYSSLMAGGSSPANLSPDILNCWNGIPEGMTADSPNRIATDINPWINYGDSYTNAISDRWLVSRNFLCFKNLSVAYKLPVGWIRPLGVTGIKVSFQAENLYIHTARKGLSPQLGNNGSQGNYLVPARVYTFGLSLDL